MNPNDVIEAYVVDVMRRVPGKDRNEIGLELRDLLTEMLAERTQDGDKTADDAAVLTMLRDFGTPAEVAARYRSPGVVIIPATQTRSFALLSIIGVGLQWALTLPRVSAGQPLVAWWFSWGLGALWWPGFLAMIALVAAGARQTGLFKPVWRPRVVDPERINRGAWTIALAWCLIGAVVLICLPWIPDLMPDPLSRVFAFDPDFLREPAPPVLVLWLAAFAILGVVLYQGRWSPLTRRLHIACNLAFIALLVWWLTVGDIFQTKTTNDGARAGIGLVVLAIILDVIYKLYRRRTRLRLPNAAG